MKSTTFLWAAALSSALAACATSPQEPAVPPPAREQPPADYRGSAESESPVGTSASPVAPAPRTYRAGRGTVESATVLSLASAPAAAGGTAGPATNATMAYRLKMADGSTHEVVQAGERYEVGERVELTPEGRLVRP